MQGDINDAGKVTGLLEQYQQDELINFAAEFHVDRSITGPTDFAHTNIQGTLRLLGAAVTGCSSATVLGPFVSCRSLLIRMVYGGYLNQRSGGHGK